MKTHHETLRALSSLEERAHLSTLVAVYEAAREAFSKRGGAAIVVWLEDGEPMVMTTSIAKFAVVVGRWITSTQRVDAPPATPAHERR